MKWGKVNKNSCLPYFTQKDVAQKMCMGIKIEYIHILHTHMIKWWYITLNIDH